tara:strand:+ start:1361 stop:1879 length:519 start_codon:yes stop_codon:yes gene_type:complete
MKLTIIITAALLLAACGKREPSSLPRPPVTQTLTHKAYYYIGLNEQRDRVLIKEIMGIDPVITEWCAAFINMILFENDLPMSSTVSPYPLTARSFLEWGTEVKEPTKGDIIVFRRGEPWQGHVGFYVSTTTDQNGVEYYNILGGNQGNAVSIDPYAISRVVSIRRRAVLGPA